MHTCTEYLIEEVDSHQWSQCHESLHGTCPSNIV